MSIFCFGIYFGPLLGPVIGGALTTTSLTWRASFWFCTAYAAMSFALVAFFLPETYRDSKLFDDVGSISTAINDVRLQESEIGTQCSKEPSSIAAATTKSTKPSLWKIVAQPLFMLRYPHVLLASSIFAIALSCLLVVETLLPVLFSSHYDLSSWAIGLSYIASGAGNVLGAIVNGILSDRLLMHAKRGRQDGHYVVEDRLAIHLWPCGLIFMPLGMLMFGWGIQTNQSYWIAIVGFGIQAFGSQQIITCVSAYLIDATPTHGASVSAASNLIGLILASILSTCANPMAHAIGSGFAMVFFTALTLLSMGLLLILKVYGKELRRSSGFTTVEKTCM
ncbi:hypothetical protein O0I10_011512 [Lichtheimia ornata]|uniref:Major facilitator superfamily (MFS) profile domain-containing protein n=1 Tax=Lichtheimia ornata TaxID=688661 RepID=A0AAD7XU05_9FUNG|nr:uncharacterized protein O0I10_011512 [Lichtheimia ornata]KAJ8652838.1 hypothetical protein O0I10_011512 [Lichtheimia ornata]